MPSNVSFSNSIGNIEIISYYDIFYSNQFGNGNKIGYGIQTNGESFTFDSTNFKYIS